eukprot:TRINITY_DN12328_c0_g3_i1.p3 TRINITY_DN12328_c0_g3~~TRINITY_DN12328_c0_g3_i1.p3  ORF type:complete len:127 (-),score=33.43 TRINITY_DN12328_c0_g3_i1:227-607(-)
MCIRDSFISACKIYCIKIMGVKIGVKVRKQVLMLGLTRSGKTRFLYESYAFSGSSLDTQTRGYNYEVISTEKGRIGVWDIGGCEMMRDYWCYFYQNIEFAGVVFMVQASSVDSLKYMDESIGSGYG